MIDNLGWQSVQCDICVNYTMYFVSQTMTYICEDRKQVSNWL